MAVEENENEVTNPTYTPTQLGASATAGKEAADQKLVNLVEGGASSQEIRQYLQSNPEAARGSYAYGVQQQLDESIAGQENLSFEQLKQAGYTPPDAVEVDGGYVTQTQINDQINSMLAQGAITPDYAETLRGMPTGAAYVAIGIRARQLEDVRKADIETIKMQYPEYAAEIESKGAEAVIPYIKETRTHKINVPEPISETVSPGPGYIPIAGNEYITAVDAYRLQKQSPYGYDILVNQGYAAYQQAVEQAKQVLEPYRRPKGYRLAPAVAAGVDRDTLSLLFTPDAVEKAWRVHREPEKVTSGLPAGMIAALPVAGAVAVAEPTPVVEVIIGGALLTAAIYAAVQGNKINWGALWDEVKGAFTQTAGRPPTAAEEETIQASTLNIMATSGVSVQPPPFTSKAESIGTVMDPRSELIITQVPPFAMKPEQLGTLTEPYQRGVSIQPEPFTTRPESLGLVMAAANAATAEKQLEDIIVIVRPKIIEPGKYLPATVPKTQTALVELDKAVQEAYSRGEITERNLRTYQTARDNYIAKRDMLNSAMRAYVGGTQPELIQSDIASIALLANIVSQLQNIAYQAAVTAYNESIQMGKTEAQARADANTAAMNAVQTQVEPIVSTATSTITNTATKQAVRSAVKSMVNDIATTATATAIATPAATTATAVTPFPILPGSGGGGGGQQTYAVQSGSYAFKQGFLWYYIPPPYDMDKPISLPPGVMPKGARDTGSNSPYDTIQIIGLRRGMEMPERVDIDMGIVDAYIIPDNGGTIIFSGYGEETDVGTRLPSTTVGMDLEDYPGRPAATVVLRKLRVTKKKKRKSRREDDFSDLLEVRGEI